jgi:hypothetical protein
MERPPPIFEPSPAVEEIASPSIVANGVAGWEAADALRKGVLPRLLLSSDKLFSDYGL